MSATASSTSGGIPQLAAAKEAAREDGVPVVDPEEIRVVEAFTSLRGSGTAMNALAAIATGDAKENKWKLALRQLMFMKRMNMQFNDRTKNEIETRQQNISPTSLICSVPHFNSFSANEIRRLVDGCSREKLRPGDTLVLNHVKLASEERFCIVISGALAFAEQAMSSAEALKKAEAFPPMKLDIGDYFAEHDQSSMKVIAMEPVEYLAISSQVIRDLNQSCWEQIASEERTWIEESSETESFKRWSQHFSLSHHNCEYPTIQPGGIATCTAKAFYKDHFPRISPENELDHTLEYIKGALVSAFAADAVRIYAFDEANHRFLVKFSDEQLSNRLVHEQACVGKQLLPTRKTSLFVDPGASQVEPNGACDANGGISRELYHPGCVVLATPFFQYHSTGSIGFTRDAAKVVGYLEVVIQPESHPEMTDPQLTDNDSFILELTSQVLGRYLNFHYDEFFVVQSSLQPREIPDEPNGGDANDAIDVTQVFPSPDTTPTNDHRHLVVSVNRLHALVTEPLSCLEIRIQLGNRCLLRQNIPFGERPVSPSSRDKGDADAQQRLQSLFPEPKRDIALELPLVDVPHGSHLRLQVLNKSNEVVSWTGLHLFDFGHTLRMGEFKLDVVKFPPSTIITPLDIENCTKPGRSSMPQVVGVLELSLECSGGASAQPFEFSSRVTRKRVVTYRASIFHSSGSSTRANLATAALHSMDSLNKISAKKQMLLKKLKDSPIAELSDDERKFIWDSRILLTEDSALLSTFLLSVNWGKRDQVMEAYRLLQIWQPPTYLEALQLLSPQFSDPKVRAYAVRCMDALPDYRLQLYMPQLVQALKNERYHDSALARFLLMRSLLNPAQVGYLLYWFLRAEIHEHQTCVRFTLIMTQYLELCGSYKLEIRQSVYVMKKLEEIAGAVKQEATQTARKLRLHTELRDAVLPETFQLPLHPRTYWSSVIIEDCRVMSSKKRPLLLHLENAKTQRGSSHIIFKAGDDLRQDQLVLQILRVMDDLWRESGLDLSLSPYACISTGDQIGLIEVVEEAETLASIIYKRHERSKTKLGRKLKSVKDALVKDAVISDWLFQERMADSPDAPSASAAAVKNDATVQAEATLHSLAHANSARPGGQAERPRSVSACFPPLSPSRLFGLNRAARSSSDASQRDSTVTDTFVRSCAGYCVATYVLGVGDRHNDNIMLQRSGRFFHIDFGHFLGNFKVKLGVKRERAPFVFTPSMLDAMGGKKSAAYQQFKQLACEAFQVLRRHSNLLITLLMLALTCDIPELTCADDISWVHKTLMLDTSDEEAERRFKKLIHVALHTTTTKLNDAVHLMAH